MHFSAHHETHFPQQECIPVGCVPTAAVAATRCQNWGWVDGAYYGGVPTSRGPLSHTPWDGAYRPGQTMGPETGSDIYTPLVNRMTDAYENFTFLCGR